MARNRRKQRRIVHIDKPSYNDAMLTKHEIEIRVRYHHTDAQARVHHANYLNFFEVGRVELLRASGYSYRRLEEEGLMLVVSEITCRYFLPAAFDDLLRLNTTVVKAKGARIEHTYELHLDEQLLAEGHSIIACIGRDGSVQRLPEHLRLG